MSITKNEALCQHYIAQVYNAINKPTLSPIKQPNKNEIYGEILVASSTKLLKNLELSNSDVFFDLGSGAGKLVIQAFLQTQTSAAYGIEINQNLYQTSLAALKRLEDDLPSFFMNHRKIGFTLGSFLEISFQNASVVFINATCFSQKLLHELAIRICKFSNIHTVASIRPINLHNFKFIKTIKVECTWDSALCYLYKRI